MKEKLVEQRILDFEYLIPKVFHCLAIKHKHLDGELEDAAYCGLYNAAQTYSPERGKFTTYAFRCIKNAILNGLKKENNFYSRNLLSEESTEDIDSGVYILDSFHEHEALKLLKGIKKEYSHRTTVDGISYIELMVKGYSSPDISEITEDSPEKIRACISRARTKLKKNKKVLAFFGRSDKSCK